MVGNIEDNLIVVIPCIFVLAFSVYLVYSVISGWKVSDKDYEEWCQENSTEYQVEEE